MITDKVAEERAFIHDLSSPLMVALGMVDLALSKLPEDEDAVKTKLQKAKKSLDKMSELLKDRRTQLLERLEKSID